MPEPQLMLLKTNLKHLRLPTMGAEFAKLEQLGVKGVKVDLDAALPEDDA